MRFHNTFVKAIVLATAMFGIVSFTYGQANGQPGSGQPGQTAVVTPGNLNQTPWFSNPAVRQHLNLNADQYNGLNNAYQSAWGTYQKGIGGIDPKAAPATRQQQMNQLQQNFYNDFSPATTKYLKDATQRQRFNQLYWQHRGLGAFADPTIADPLNITQAQRDQLNKHYQDWSTQMGKLHSMYQTNPHEATKQFENLQSQYTDRLNSVLTPQQQTGWQQMTGTPYTFSPDIYFRSGPNTTPGGKK